MVPGETDLDAIRKYLVENPLKWAEGPENAQARRLASKEWTGDSERF